MKRIILFNVNGRNLLKHRLPRLAARFAGRLPTGKKALITIALVIPLLFFVILMFSTYKAGS